MTEPTPYGDAALALHESGLGWPLPLPAGQKKTPPQGFTGWEGDEPDDDRVGSWVQANPQGNVALRLAPDVIGIDIDAYKDGVISTLQKLEEAHGALPETWGSTSRVDGLSGIWLYVVSPEASHDAHGVAAPGIDIIRYGHRYAVAPPSVHPSGLAYAWRIGPKLPPVRGSSDALDYLVKFTDDPPTRETLAVLPAAWASHLVLGEQCPCGLAGGQSAPEPTFVQTGSWADQYVAPSSIARTQGKSAEEWLTSALAALERGAGSRHDTTLRAAQALVRYAEDGSSDAVNYIEKLGAAFVKSVTDDGSRSAEEADREYRRMLSGAARNVAKAPSPKAGVPVALAQGDDPWEADPVSSFAALADEPIPWLVKGFLVDGTYGVLGGSEKTLKSQMAYHLGLAVASGADLFGHYEVEKPGNVLLYSGEGGQRLLARRLTRLVRSYGVSRSVLGKIFVTDRTGRLTDRRFIESFGRNLERTEPHLVIIDPAYSYMGGNLEAGNVFEMGEVLTRMTALVQDFSDATLIVTHHATKVASGNKEMSLGALSQAGFREWVDSWMLLWHREDPLVSQGSFKLRAKVGSRQWGENVLDIDYEDGTLDLTTGRFSQDPAWTITDVGHSALQAARSGGRPGRDTQALKADALDVVLDETWQHTVRQLRRELKDSQSAREAIDEMLSSGTLVTARATRLDKAGRRRSVEVVGISQEMFNTWRKEGSRALQDKLPSTYPEPPDESDEV